MEMDKPIKNFISVSDTDIYVENSYTVSKKLFKLTLLWVKDEYPDKEVVKTRKIWHMCLEWASHNFLYNLNIEKERTGSVDLDTGESIKHKILYTILGVIAWPFIN